MTTSIKTPASQDLRQARKKAADEFFESYNLGDWTIVDHQNWNEDDVYWSKRVYGDKPSDTDPNKRENFHASFGVEFAPNTDKIIDSWLQT